MFCYVWCPLNVILELSRERWCLMLSARKLSIKYLYIVLYIWYAQQVFDEMPR
ncbi:hypothetical protein HanRHA438_Chr17g0818001 [Helianthus annuus]|nr:hypothetical protein HanIR_Chr17g0877121 [Helianthus annuus]KAJ0826764.1 hypothetical protein HanRHA438_Chr17g0818001 [Helianthus annuus]